MFMSHVQQAAALPLCLTAIKKARLKGLALIMKRLAKRC